MNEYIERLIYNVPGIVTSFEISYNPNASNVINVKSILKRLNQVSASTDKSQQVAVDSVINPQQVPSESVPALQKKRSSNHDIIGKLEKKWYTEPQFENDQNDIHESSFVSNESVISDTAEKVSHDSSNKLSKKISNKFDAYDYEDNFIDDSECVVQVNAKLKSKKLKTKHDGFFVSSGQLEVEVAKDVLKKAPNDVAKDGMTNAENIIASGHSSSSSASSSKSKNKQTSNHVTNGSAKDITEKVISKPKKSVVSTQLSSESAISPTKPSKSKNVSNGHSESSPTPKSPGSNSVALDTASINPDASLSTPQPQPIVKWQPSDAETEALEQYRSAVSHSGLKASKNYFPYELEGALDKLDTAAPVKHIQYLQAVCDAVGGLYTIGRLKLLLLRLQLERKAKPIKEKLHISWNNLKTQLKSRICPAPPPVAAPASTSITSECASSSDASVTQQATVDISEASADVGDAVPSESAVDSSTASALAVPSAPTPEYKWICKWDTACRILLLDTVQLAQEWVRLENAYRGKFTQADKKCRTEEEICLFEERVFIADMFSSICAEVFPLGDCACGDVAYFRKAIITEKTRRKNKERKLSSGSAAPIADAEKVVMSSTAPQVS